MDTKFDQNRPKDVGCRSTHFYADNRQKSIQKPLFLDATKTNFSTNT